ncbi:MFS transporter [Humibacillus xanthopallidus]|uniref:MFS transporter n=1 Tax=Humibacillus xanthopallidus TaxID=412689 RepID=A0A543PNJ6_9MICO|nr:MFS transporter [Humibacillus xanthopallidus]TQN45661.1 MFS transporter [Humibacillus xanthopallidus]
MTDPQAPGDGAPTTQDAATPAAAPASAASHPATTSGEWSAWRVVWWFGFVSLAADMVYEGARSVYGPLLASLGATATVVGLVTGAGEAMALVLRLVFGPLADRTGRYWSLTVVGYGMTAVCVPLLAVTPFVGAAGLVLASVLILLERAGKAVRSPSKSALLAHVATAVGRGRGFGVHKALDQVGALAGPLLVAAVIAAAAGAIWPAMAVLAIPGAAAMLLLAVIRSRVPDPSVYDGTEPRPESPAAQTNTRGPGLRGWFADAVGAHLPRTFFGYALAAGLTTGGLVTFGIIGFHLTVAGLVPVAGVPLVYAAAMGVEALAALGVGLVYDRHGAAILYAVPVLVALVPPLALAGQLWVVLIGVAVWALAYGVQDSTVKALVAEVVEAPRRATAYGVFAGIQGAFAIVGGVSAGWLYERSLIALVIVVAVTQLVALVLLARTIGSLRRRPTPV